MYLTEIPEMLFRAFGQKPVQREGKAVAQLVHGSVIVLRLAAEENQVSVYPNERLALNTDDEDHPDFTLSAVELMTKNFHSKFGNEVQTRIIHRLRDSESLLRNPNGVTVYKILARAAELACGSGCLTQAWWKDFPKQKWDFPASPWEQFYLRSAEHIPTQEK
ncbi:MAG: hypothetical protein WCV85_00460 [Patescibacteria group bacterium]|jgi:hypothetical protein